MSFENKIAKSFGLHGDNWQKHTNPWSIWTRFATLPFFILAVWSRIWIGWYSLIPITLLIIWIKFNPILFKKPKSFDNWGARSVLGEKYWAERKKTPVPKHHSTPIRILTLLQITGSLILIIGLWNFQICLTCIGTLLIYMSKMWFLDRMVWVFKDMTNLK